VSSATFWRLPSTLITVEALWSQQVFQEGKQVVVSRSEIRAVRRVVKQLPDEMLQQCSSAAAFHAFCSDWPYAVFYSVSQYASDVSVVLCCTNSTISTPLLSQKAVAISFLADNVCLNFFGLFDDCVCTNFFDCSLVSTFTSETHVLSPVTRTIWLKNSSPSLWYHCKKVCKSRSHFLRFVRTREHFRNPSCTKHVIAFTHFILAVNRS
jgi:hypothetical protein